ncbi:MAG TPA: c-type cytochrome [Afifellaceae bacterium]|nr:c-type cytochrome [Afifellaceae bacterium]
MRSFKTLFILLVLVAAGTAVWWWYQSAQPDSGPARQAGGPLVDVTVPAVLSATAQDGKILFDRNCAECHGENAAGSEKGPPLVHKIYEPSHHGDAAFYLAARNGVRAHHWPFGDMPPRPEVSDPEMAAIVAYVREFQQANGIR